MVQLGLDRFGLNVELRPHRPEDFILGDQSPRVLDEVAQQRKGPGRQSNALVFTAVRALPQALVDGVEAKREEFNHEPAKIRTYPSLLKDILF